MLLADRPRPQQSRSSRSSGRTVTDVVLTREGFRTTPALALWLTEDEVAQRLRDLREDSTAWLGRSFTGQFSLAGAQAKTALLLEDGRWAVPSGALATTHILKPAGSAGWASAATIG